MSESCEHNWERMSDDAVGDIRKKTRTGRPNGSWLEGVSRCSKCGVMEAEVSWYGQVHKAEVVESEPGTPVVKWPTRQSTPGGAGGMGMG